MNTNININNSYIFGKLNPLGKSSKEINIKINLKFIIIIYFQI